MSWKGCIVARLLPETVSKDYHNLNKPIARQIDPALLKQGAGPVSYYRQRIVSNSSTSSRQNQSLPRPSTENKETTTEATFTAASGQVTTLSLYLYSNSHHDSDSDDAAFSLLQMYRDTNEDITKTLKRMELSVTNKLYPKHRAKSKAKRSAAAVQNEQTQISTPTIAPPSIWQMDSENPSLPGQEWDISNQTNGSLWKDAMATPVTVQLDLLANDCQQDVSSSTHSNSNSVVSLQLLVDSCPPTILSVSTFEDFTASLFAGVPCRVRVQAADLLYATRAVVDWYVDGVMVQHDNDLYVPTVDDVDKHVAVLITPIRECHCENCEGDDSCHCNSHDGQGCEESYQFERTVQPLPTNTLLELRPSWTTTTTTTTTTPRTTSSSSGSSSGSSNAKNTTDIRVVTYNILADQNAFSKTTNMPVYPYCPREFLERKRRMPLILHELVSYDQADILCLQEVDEAVFYNLFQPVLERYGFSGYFSCKVSPGNKEGCAMFWSTSRFCARDSSGSGSLPVPVPESDQMTHGLSKLFDVDADVDDEWTSMKDMTALLEHRRDLRHVISSRLGHVAQLLALQDQITGRRFLVVNTHLFYHPLASHIRLMQMYVLCRQVGREIIKSAAASDNDNDNSNNDNDECSVIMCGDFNSSLTNTVGRLVTERNVPANFRDLQLHLRTFQWGQRSWGETGTIATANTNPTTAAADDFPAMSLPESFPVLSPAVKQAPSFTHYIARFFGTLDHILIGPGLVSVKSAPMPAVRDVARQTAMPSEHLPSDHVSLVVDVSIEHK
jgi:mRNA deadenylase 3'-5' endonuclease subunit Ccr4